MKKLFLALALLMTVTSVTVAQTNERAIGLRGGYGTELSYLHPLKDATRLEVDLGLYGFTHGDFVFSGIHQWLFAPNGGFNLFAGLGPQLGSYWWGNEDKYTFGLGVAGQIGAEYNFDFPLQLSLDWRPSWSLIPSGRGFGYEGFAFGIRYRF